MNYLKTLMHREICLNYHHWQLVQARNLAMERLIQKMTSFDEETSKDFTRLTQSRSRSSTECYPEEVEFLESIQTSIGCNATLEKFYESGHIDVVRFNIRDIECNFVGRFPKLCTGTYSRMLRQPVDREYHTSIFWSTDTKTTSRSPVTL